jgi:hypothetical protein
MPVDIIELPADYDVAKASQHIQPQQPAAAAVAVRPKIYLATPCYGCQMTVVFLASVLGLQGACAQRGVELMVDFIGNESLVERARNILAARFLQSDATHLLFIDADIGFRPETVFRLLELDKDIATAVYPKKAFDWAQVKAKLEAGSEEPVAQMGLDFNINISSAQEAITNGFVRVLDSATGFMLIKRAALQRTVDHYRGELACVNDIQGQEIREYVAVFACMIDPQSRRFLSEDFSFCRRYQAIGGEIWADIASPLAHIGDCVYHGNFRERLVVAAAS